MQSQAVPLASPQLPASVPRGIHPSLLLDQIRNTAPFVFEGDPFFERLDPHRHGYAVIVRDWAQRLRAMTHLEYFQLCVAAHHTTVATFVPTDVDNAIRFKLWSPGVPTEIFEAMARFVIETGDWDPSPLTGRFVGRSGHPSELVSGHNGEWFSTAAAAYGALRRKSPAVASEVAAKILREVHREAEIFKKFVQSRQALDTLRCATLIAHNLGDLDRVLDMWKIPDDDVLKQSVFKLGHPLSPKDTTPHGAPIGSEADQFRRGVSPSLTLAGDLNKAMMADENHRHFALRVPRSLRRYRDLLIPTGPFFDDWGRKVAKHPGITPREVGEIVDALVIGWEKLQKKDQTKGPVGYTRALAGILDAFPGGFNALSNELPARVVRDLKAGTLRALCSVPQGRFEKTWEQTALAFISRYATI